MEGLLSLSRRYRQVFLITHIDEIKEALANIILVEEGSDGSSQVRFLTQSAPQILPGEDFSSPEYDKSTQGERSTPSKSTEKSNKKSGSKLEPDPFNTVFGQLRFTKPNPTDFEVFQAFENPISLLLSDGSIFQSGIDRVSPDLFE